MEILRRTLKVYVLALCAFAALSLILAAVIRFTGFPETWTFAGLVAALSLVSLLTGAMEGGIIGKRGMIVGLSLIHISVHHTPAGSHQAAKEAACGGAKETKPLRDARRQSGAYLLRRLPYGHSGHRAAGQRYRLSGDGSHSHMHRACSLYNL